MVVALVAGTSASAQPADVEVFGGLGVFAPSLDATYDASYTPSRVVGIHQLFGEPDPRSRARQLLLLEGENGVGFGLGLNVYPNRVLGFQFLFDRASLEIQGENPTHEVELTYDTIAFPTPERVVATTTYAFEPPDSEGSLDVTAFSFNLAARFGAGRAVSGSVSGGVSYLPVRVEGERLAALAAWLGGHAVLFSELYETSYVTETANTFGFNVGGQLDLSLGPHAALFVDGRAVLAPSTEVEVELREVLSNNVPAVPVERIDAFLDLPPIEVDPGYVRLLFGLKWKP